MELLLTGDFIDAEEALRRGVVTSVHDDGDLLPRALELATRLATGPTVAIEMI